MKKSKRARLAAILLAAAIGLPAWPAGPAAHAEAPAAAAGAAMQKTAAATAETATPTPASAAEATPKPTATPETSAGATAETAAPTPAPEAPASPAPEGGRTAAPAPAGAADGIPAPAAEAVEQTLGDFRVLADPALVDYDETRHTLYIKDGAQVTLRMAEGLTRTSVSRVVVEKDADADITLDGVALEFGDVWEAISFQIAPGSTGDVRIKLAEGSVNRLISGGNAAGLQKNNGGASDPGSLTIEGPGTLIAAGGHRGAGIGGSWNEVGSNITILSGTVIAEGGNYSEGIGAGAYHLKGSNITIRGGSVTAMGKGQYGLGGAGSLTVTGGTVTAGAGTQAVPLQPDFDGYPVLVFGNRAENAPSRTVVGYTSGGRAPDLTGCKWVQIRPLTGFTLPVTAEPGQAVLNGHDPVTVGLQAMLYARIDDPGELVPLPDAKLTWSLSGAESSGTSIDPQTGRLTVGADETAAALTVAVRSGETVSTVTVPVWQPLTVRFDSRGGTPVPERTVARGTLLAPPAAPVRSGYRFTGWYTDAGATRAWDPAVPVTGDLVLYAGWAALPPPAPPAADSEPTPAPTAAPLPPAPPPAGHTAIPATGDAGAPGAWLAAFLLSGAGCAFLSGGRRKRGRGGPA